MLGFGRKNSKVGYFDTTINTIAGALNLTPKIIIIDTDTITLDEPKTYALYIFLSAYDQKISEDWTLAVAIKINPNQQVHLIYELLKRCNLLSKPVMYCTGNNSRAEFLSGLSQICSLPVDIYTDSDMSKKFTDFKLESSVTNCVGCNQEKKETVELFYGTIDKNTYRLLFDDVKKKDGELIIKSPKESKVIPIINGRATGKDVDRNEILKFNAHVLMKRLDKLVIDPPMAKSVTVNNA